MEKDDDFLASHGMSPDEQRKASNEAAMDNLFSKMEGIFGNYRESVRSEAYDKMRLAGYQPEQIKMYNPHTESDDVHVTHHHGEWHAHWYGTGLMEVHHNSRPDQPLDVVGVSEEITPDKWKEHQSALEEWVRDNGASAKTHQLPYI